MCASLNSRTSFYCLTVHCYRHILFVTLLLEDKFFIKNAFVESVIMEIITKFWKFVNVKNKNMTAK